MAQGSIPAIDYEKEVRVAVVMYGGVSLAIYINGVAQELLRLVRSTAPGTTRKELKGSELVYRKVAWLMGDEGRRLSSYPTEEEDLPSTRFLIDVISGTSAGGINGIFLAKALANGQDIKGLQQLWVTEGDIAVLINDAKSKVSGVPLRDPPESLLNSQRMYAKLLDAFTGMDNGGESESGGTSPYVEELDLFVTTTDIEGIPLPIKLADRVVYERRHRNVFHFAYSNTEEIDNKGTNRNDFISANNPFLAFAARCTSSFPFAFEPMKFSDTSDVLRLYPKYKDAKTDDWINNFFRIYQNLPDEVRPQVPITERAFGDGGYLDNKPFSYAIETLANRQADVPVERKLFYIEPSPEHPELQASPRTADGKYQGPDVLQNVTACLLTLPRYETIREDLQRILERNRLLARIDRILSDLRGEMEPDRIEESAWIPDDEWAKMSLADLRAKRGRGYLAYHRLLISSITDDIAETVTRVIGFDEKSDYLVAIRCLVRVWRGMKFTDAKVKTDTDPAAHLEPINSFVLDFDINYPLRQLALLREKLDCEFCRKKDQRDQLRKLKSVVNEAWQNLRELKRHLRSRVPGRSPLSELLAQSAISWRDLDTILGCGGSCACKPETPSRHDGGKPGQRYLEECEFRAEELLQKSPKVKELFDKMADAMRSKISSAVKDADAKVKKALGLEGFTGDPRALNKQEPTYYYLNYDLFDMITFPILYETGMGEIDNVEVMRISPEDANFLIDERQTGCSKLAGTALGHFGAFMEQRWRESDILWGRLDGAERLIKAMLPDHEDTQALIGEALAAIVRETLETPEGKELLAPNEKYGLLAESMMRTRTGKSDPNNLGLFIDNLKKHAGSDLQKRLDHLIDDTQLRGYYLDAFKTQSKLSPEDTLRTSARATTVVGRMLEGLSKKYSMGGKYAAYLVRLGRIFWGFVELSVPHKIPNLLLQHWLMLAYVLELALVIGGMLFEPAVRDLGLKLLLATLAIDGISLFLSSLMGRVVWWRRGVAVAGCLAVALLVGGIYFHASDLVALANADAEKLWNLFQTPLRRLMK